MSKVHLYSEDTTHNSACNKPKVSLASAHVFELVKDEHRCKHCVGLFDMLKFEEHIAKCQERDIKADNKYHAKQWAKEYTKDLITSLKL